MKSRTLPIATWLVLVTCIALPSTSGAELTAVTLFGCDENGTVDVAMRHNTGPVDAAWDLFLYEGDVFDPATGSVEQIRWLNDTDDHTVRMPLAPGTHTLTFHFEMSRPWPVIGMNLFFDGKHDRAGISVKAPMQTATGAVPEFSVNASQRTMGWPITDIPASGELACGGPDRGIWDFSDTQSACRITLKSFRCSIPEIDHNLDLVGPHGMGPNGTPDAVGQLVLEVEPCTARPSDLFVWLQTVAGVTAGAPDMTDPWNTQLDGKTVPPPFSFTCGEQSARDLLKAASCRVEHETLDADRRAHRVTYSAPDSGLEVRWEGVEYPRFQTVEWTVYLKNVGQEDTPLLKDILALDTRFTRRGDEGEFILHHNRGDTCAPDAFEPLVTTLGPEESLRMAPQGGRPTNAAFPYFNLRAGDEGVVIAIGWPGQWAAEFARDKQVGLRIEAGQELTCLTLHPGEEIRTPLIVLQFTTQADWVAAQNSWRQWMIAHNIPRPGGRPLPLPMFNACSSHQFAEMTRASEENQKQFIDHYLAKGLNIDYWWMDAGWYVGAEEKGWPWTGTWEVDRRPHRFPNGLRAVSDHAHAKNVQTIVWFEPERVAAGTWLATERPDWVLGGSGGGLLNLGNPETWHWLTNHIDKLIREEGIDLYRQDFNMDPLSYWRGNDAENRQGITENKYVVGYLAYWDELLRRHPGLLIDSCASGGRRNDLETMRRAVPLLRSDYLFEPVGQQGHTYGLAFWLPFFGTGYCPSNSVGWGWGTGGISYDPYTRRSNMCPANTACFDFRVEVDDALLLKLYREWLAVAPDFFGDYYPLTDYNRDADAWLAWQFHQPTADRGMVQAFRRAECDYFGGQFRLRGLDPTAQYEVVNHDQSGVTLMTGEELMQTGLPISIAERPGAALISYSRKQ